MYKKYFFILALSSLEGYIYTQQKIVISISLQTLSLYEEEQCINTYPISTGIRGTGDKQFQTPLGKLRVCNKLGATAPLGTIFKSTIKTKQIAPLYNDPVPVTLQEDLITTRIIQLEGLEQHNNNTFSRGVWIHGTPYEGDIGSPISHGCIRMKNNDIIKLFEKITVGIQVNINM